MKHDDLKIDKSMPIPDQYRGGAKTVKIEYELVDGVLMSLVATDTDDKEYIFKLVRDNGNNIIGYTEPPGTPRKILAMVKQSMGSLVTDESNAV